MLYPLDSSSVSPCVTLRIGAHWLPAMFDSGSSLSFIRQDVLDNIKKLGLPCIIENAEERCVMANGEPCVISEIAKLGIKIRSFSWKCRFLVLADSPIPCILGVDFMARAKVRLDFGARRYSFLFRPEQEFDFEQFDLAKCMSRNFPCAEKIVAGLGCGSLSAGPEESRDVADLLRSFPALFSDKLGTVKGMVCHLDLSDSVPVRSRPYQCSPPRLRILREIVNELMDKGVVRKSYSQYASPAFLVPNSSGGHRMVVDYRLLNKKIVFDAFPMPSVEFAFANFDKATIFSVLDLNSAYYQIPLSAKIRKATAFCTPFGLFEFTKLPMGISVGCQVLSRVVDSLFGDLKHKFVYNFMDDLVVYSRSREEHLLHLRQVLRDCRRRASP